MSIYTEAKRWRVEFHLLHGFLYAMRSTASALQLPLVYQVPIQSPTTDQDHQRNRRRRCRRRRRRRSGEKIRTI